MIKILYAFILLIGTLLNASGADTTPSNGAQEPSTTRDIFQPPSKSNVSQIHGTSTPWVIPDLIPTIEEFKKNVFVDLMNSETVKNIWDMKTKRKETRAIFFKILNKDLYDLGHPVPTALANIVSKAASLFEPLEMPVYFEADAINVAEFLLKHGVAVNRETATKYVDSIIKALESADISNKESVWKAILSVCPCFVASNGFNLINVIDELMEIFTSELIVLHDK